MSTLYCAEIIMNHFQKNPFPHNFLSISNRDELPDDHPDKPKGYFQQAVAKAQASLEAEAAALAGCKVEIMVRLPFIVQSYVFFS